MDKNFKVGDRVRIVADVKQSYNMWVEKGDTGVIVDGKPAAGFQCVKIDGCAGMGYVCVESKYLETDATYDCKTAFLSELKELMSKYHAHFEVDFATQATYLVIGKERYPYLVPKYIEKGRV